MWNYPYYTMMNPGYWIVSPLLTLLIVILVISLLFRILRGSRRHELREHIKELKNDVFREETPLEVLKMRYAKGEIDKKQFEEMKKDLNNS